MAVTDFEQKRNSMLDEFYSKQFILGGWIGATDTYKRTMWSAVPDVALKPASYTLTLRKPLPEPGAGQRLIMAGHEAMLAQWFYKPLRRRDIELARHWYAHKANTKAFPAEVWDYVLSLNMKEDVYLPINVWGFPGGQTFLAGVPCMSFEGIGGVVSYIEPAMCRYFAPIIQATKARLMKEATTHDAEFGLRSAPSECTNITLLLARYVGGGGQFTSNDTTEFLFPQLFKSIGTIGHELMCASQSYDKTLQDAEYEMMDKYVTAMGSGSLLCDLVDAETVGLTNAIRVIKNHPETSQIGIRVDSGNIAEQCVLYYHRMKSEGIDTRRIVFEDEVNPESVRHVYQVFREKTGIEPEMLFPGAGGYWWRLVHRDTVAAVFKRSATNGIPNIKFSNSPGKESIPGTIRLYQQGNKLLVADQSESVDGVPLFVELVRNGRIVYSESFESQANRASATWNHIQSWECSELIKHSIERFRTMREREILAARSSD